MKIKKSIKKLFLRILTYSDQERKATVGANIIKEKNKIKEKIHFLKFYFAKFTKI